MSAATAPVPRPVLLAQLVGELVADATAAAQARAENRPRGPVTGLKTLDERLGGYLAPGVHVIQGAPGDGKTAWVLQAVARCQAAALVVSCEMPIIELFRRLISRESNTFLEKLKDGTLGASAIERLAIETARRLPSLALVDATLAHADPRTIAAQAEALREQAGTGHVLVAIDSLQVWARGAMPGASEYEAVSAGVVAARSIADTLKAPVLVTSLRNRAGQASGGMHASKGSWDVEYGAETVIDLTREKDAKWDAAGEVASTIAVHKNRHGEAGKPISLKFCGRLQSFREV
jgi:replicative DNA helicase